MNTRTIFIISLLAVPALVGVCLAQVGPTVVPRTQMDFPSWGFSANIPTQAEQVSIPPSGNVLHCQVFVSGQYAYVVRVTKLPTDTLASTGIELAIQSRIKSALPGSIGRWQYQSSQGELFKGLTGPVEDEIASVPLIKKLLKDDLGVQSIAMIPLKDEKSPVLSIGVVALSSLRQEAYNQAVGVVGFLKFNRNNSVASAAPVKPPVAGALTPQKPKPPVVSAAKPIVPGAKPAVTPAKPIVPKPKPAQPRKLEKGEIELTGVLDKVDKAGMTLEMTVDHIRMPGKSLEPRKPPAPKHVTFKSIPAGLKAGIRIAIVGKNLGIGAPITADFIGLE